ARGARVEELCREDARGSARRIPRRPAFAGLARDDISLRTPAVTASPASVGMTFRKRHPERREATEGSSFIARGAGCAGAQARLLVAPLMLALPHVTPFAPKFAGDPR